jgi:hypothetical protein
MQQRGRPCCLDEGAELIERSEAELVELNAKIKALPAS